MDILREISIQEKRKVDGNVPTLQQSSISHCKPSDGDKLGLFFIGMICCAGTMAPVFSLVGVAANLDPFYFALEQLILPHPYYRSLSIILASWFARFILGYLCVIEITRWFSAMVLILIVAMFAVLSIIRKLDFVACGDCFSLYIQLRIVITSIEPFTRLLTFSVILWSQIGVVLLWWLVLKCYKYMPIYMYCADLLIAIYSSILMALTLPTLSKIEANASAFIRARLNGEFCANKQQYYKRKCYRYMLWRAQKSVCLECGSIFKFEGNVTMTYFSELINNLVNAVILINPTSF